MNIKYGYVSQACMLLLHRAESNKAGRILPWASDTNGRKLLIQYCDAQIPGVHGELALQCECPAELSKGHVFLASRKRNDNKKQQSKASKTQSDTPAVSNCGTVHFLKRIYNISKYYIYIYFKWYKVTIDSY